MDEDDFPIIPRPENNIFELITYTHTHPQAFSSVWLLEEDEGHSAYFPMALHNCFAFSIIH